MILIPPGFAQDFKLWGYVTITYLLEEYIVVRCGFSLYESRLGYQLASGCSRISRRDDAQTICLGMTNEMWGHGGQNTLCVLDLSSHPSMLL